MTKKQIVTKEESEYNEAAENLAAAYIEEYLYWRQRVENTGRIPPEDVTAVTLALYNDSVSSNILDKIAAQVDCIHNQVADGDGVNDNLLPFKRTLN